jgi:DNA primase
MFPLFDPGGRVVGFSGRTLESGPDIPKYVNSPETEYYKKSELLYGYDKAKHGIRRFDFSLIVEGQFDVVLCHQAGYTNTVAVSGTALTLNHVQLLERLSNRVVLALDADRAGIAAVRRSADVMLRRGLDVKVAEMPLGTDPADLILSDPKAFKKIIGASVHVIEFLLHVLKAQNLDERTFKLRAREEILPYILLLPNKIDQEHFEQKVAEVLGTSADAVHFEVERFRESGKYNASPNNDLPLSAAPATGKELVEYEQRYHSLLVYLLGAIDELAPQVVERVKVAMSQITSLTYDELLEKTPISARAEVALKVGVQLSEYPKRVFEEEFVHILNQLRTIVIRQKLKEAKDRLKAGEMLGAEKKEEEWLVKVAALQKELQATGFSQAIFDSP